MTLLLACTNCGQRIHIYPHENAHMAQCDDCHHRQKVTFSSQHVRGFLEDCPCCGRRDFYTQKDFNRKIGILLFIVAAILSFFTYGMALIALWLIDLFLFKRLPFIAICYKCQTVFRGAANIDAIGPFDHEKHDRIVYGD